MIAASKGLLKEPQPFYYLVGGVDIKRRPVAFGESFKRDFTAVEGAAWLRVMKRAR